MLEIHLTLNSFIIWPYQKVIIQLEFEWLPAWSDGNIWLFLCLSGFIIIEARTHCMKIFLLI